MFTINNKFLSIAVIFFGFLQFSYAQEVSFVPIDTNLDNPTCIANAGDGSGRLFITEQDGRILIYNGNQILATPFIDISSKVDDGGSEEGLLGLAFHPNYENNGFFYVNYTDNSGNTVVERYTVSPSDPNVADPGSAETVIMYSQPASNHNGGYLAFGTDGMLYISSGDGGGSAGNRAQETTNLLGKILRIDVDGDDFPSDPGANYSVPGSNPFNNEIWVFGLRNPWRFSFDEDGNMFIGDVGEQRFEEISFQQASSSGGENYGWQCFEGSAMFSQCPTINHTSPIIEYSHNPGDNCSVTGGFRYRGSDIPELAGDYVFADYCSGRVWNATESSPGNWSFSLLNNTSLSISSFGEDESGELYAVDNPFSGGGGFYMLVNNNPGGMDGGDDQPPGGDGDEPQEESPVLFVQDSDTNTQPNEEVTLIVTVENNGGSLQDVVINVEVPDGITVNGAEISPSTGECVVDNNPEARILFPNVVCNFDSLDDDLTISLDLFVSDQNPGSIFVLFELITSTFPDDVFEGSARIVVEGEGGSSSCSVARVESDKSMLCILIIVFGLIVLRRRLRI